MDKIIKKRIVVTLLLGLMIVSSIGIAWAVPRTITGDIDTSYNLIRAGDRYFAATGTGLQNAIAYVGNDGETIFLPNETISVTSEINLDDHYYLTIEGMGYNSELYLADSSNCDIFVGSNINSLVLRNLKINGNKANNPTGRNGINLSNCVYVTLENVYITHCNEDALYIHRDAIGGDAANAIRLKDSHFKSSRNGTRLVHVSGCDIDNCDFSANTNGLWVEGGHRLSLSNPWFESNTRHMYINKGTLTLGQSTGLDEFLIENPIFQTVTDNDFDIDYINHASFINVYWYKAISVGSHVLNITWISSRENISVWDYQGDFHTFYQTTFNPTAYWYGYDSAAGAVKYVSWNIDNTGASFLSSSNGENMYITPGGNLYLLYTAEGDVYLFSSCGAAENQALRVWGDKNVGTKGSLNISYGDGTNDFGLLTGDGGVSIEPVIYNQNDEPDILSDTFAFWVDADGGPAYYLILDVAGTQVKVGMT